ncbi:MFS transporter, putative [Penicillium digitatum PHI26]|uniref:MFS transporter, putative n=2 Tax=Penicillium digitatum TaxID=36651 RepID=K9FQ87_PEND2|nr:MFS transporter, putative [Penicillium digitatum Pd1]EKV10562.1 MFS transporter, putative [Penicillium digitatum PHI26]EKV20179.1 MFS transporter, putative [Penicillium digitatum Pd1]
MSKLDAVQNEAAEPQKGDKLMDNSGILRVPLTEEDSKRICHKTDRTILVVLAWVYFLQILDKTVLGYGATFGLQADTGLTVGLITVVSAPIIYWRLDNDISTARFLNDKEKAQGMERLRANQTGTGNTEFKFSHVLEACLEPKTYLWIGMTMLLNIGASVTNVFGPLIISGLGYDKYRTTLLTMPFGALQFIIILLASYLAQTARVKSVIIAAFMLPVIAGLAILYAVARTKSVQNQLLAGYYLLAFLFGGNPLIVTWIIGNTAGTTKKSVIMSFYSAASSAGNIIGPLLFNEKDKPAYHLGLRACLGIFSTLAAVILIQWANLWLLNQQQARRRLKNGKRAEMVDLSMQNNYHDMQDKLEEAGHETVQVGDNAFQDLTDRENDEFVYIY